MPKYEETNIDKFKLESDGNVYYVDTVADTLNMVTITFGSSFSLRLNYNDIERLEETLVNARRYLQDQTIDQAGASIKTTGDRSAVNDDGRAFNDPRTW